MNHGNTGNQNARKTEDEKKSARLVVQLSPSEKESISKAAGDKSLSKFVREAILKAAKIHNRNRAYARMVQRK